MRIVNAYDRTTFVATMLDNSRRMRHCCRSTSLGYLMVARAVQRLGAESAAPKADRVVCKRLLRRLNTRRKQWERGEGSPLNEALAFGRTRRALEHALSAMGTD